MSRTVYRFTGRATGRDPHGYYHPRWDQAQVVSVIATTGREAAGKAMDVLGTHPRFGVQGFNDQRDTPGWQVIWDRVEEERSSA
jgi:hypothetical protein